MPVPKRSWDTFVEDETAFYPTLDISEGDPNNWPLDTVDQSEISAQLSLDNSAGSASNDLQHECSFEEEVCFGSITDAVSQLRTRVEDSYRPEPDSVCSFEVRSMGAYYGMYTSETLLALLNKPICAVINGLKDAKLIRFEATATLQQWGAGLEDWSRRRNAAVIPVDVTIFGAKEEAQNVGEVVAQMGLVLQRPPPQLIHGIAYSNPHYLEISHSSEADLEQNTLHLATDSNERSVSKMVEEAPVAIDASKEISSILDSLAHRTLLREHLADKRIKSHLHPHQKAALDYVHRRETGNLPPEMSLWRYNDDDEEATYHQHVISGFKSTEPLEAKGGIIADEMGLGKSLVILSIIAGSLYRAAMFRDDLKNKRESDPDHPTSEPSIATLVVVPSSLLIDNWINEIRKHTYPGDLKFFKYHGNRRVEDAPKIFTSHIVFTTYATVASEASRRANILGSISWFRIVLDEAHDIRNRATKQFSAVSNLAAQHRWCLTGTPIQNSLEDLGSLVAFLKVPVLENSMTFKRFITGQCTSATASRRNFEALRTLLASICLRRTRELIDLPDPVRETRILELTGLEREQYDAIIFDSKRAIQMAVSRRGNRKVNTAVLQSLLRLRLFCNHGVMAHDQIGQIVPTDPDENLSFLQQKDEALCVYCSNIIYAINDIRNNDLDGGFLIKECMHLVCRGCMPQFLSEKRQCPQCALGAAEQDHESSDVALSGNATAMLQAVYPSKLTAFLHDVHQHRLRHRGHKSIAFSSWKKTLDLAGKILSHHGIRSCCIDGSLTLSERLRVLREFQSPIGADVLLMTLGTGAVGLNLAFVTRVYLFEPQWNPSIELQAIGRALRLGQSENVTIVRYIMRGTIEDSNVLSRQHKKLQLADGGFSQGRKGLSNERLQSLSDIFGVDLEDSVPG